MESKYNDLQKIIFNFRREKEPLIKQLHLNVTHRCNLNCPYCFVWQRNSDMPFEIAKYGIDMVAKNTDKPIIRFIGGEPLLVFNEIVKPSIKYIRDTYSNFDLSIFTNGLLLDNEKLQFLKKNNVNLCISLDGDEISSHSHLPNNKEEFKRLYENVPNILTYFPDCLIRTTLTTANSKYFIEDFNTLINLGIKNYDMEVNWREDWDKKSLNYLKEYASYFVNYWIDEVSNDRYPIKCDIFTDKFKIINSINIADELGAYRSSEQCLGCNQCGMGGTLHASLTPEGKFYTCQSAAEMIDNDKFFIGDITTGIRDDLRQDIYRDYDSTKLRSDRCETCLFNRICNGWCAMNRYMKHGTFYKPIDASCELQCALLDGAIRAMNNLYEKEIFIDIWRKSYGID